MLYIIIIIIIIIMLFACSCQHMLNTFPFIQRTEQVLIELDISAIEEYVIIIIIIMILLIGTYVYDITHV